MSEVVVCGGGVCGLLTAMVMARSGHQVTVVERDPAPAPAAPAAWDGWERRGVNQFRQPHFLMPAFRQYADQEVPDLVPALEAAGAPRRNFLGPRASILDPEGRYDSVTARRPILESVVASLAEATPGVQVRRGVPLAGLVWGSQATPGIPHVVGVRTQSGDQITADLVIDAMGRRSPLQRWMAADGHDPGKEEAEDSGFIYYGCHIETDGEPLGPFLNYYGSASILSLPGDNETAGIGIVAWSGDAALRPLRDEARWRAAMKLFPEGPAVLSGRMIGSIVSMTGIEDRRRRLVVDGRPVVTGVVAVADAWAATNPTLGRGISLGFRHIIRLRDSILAVGLDHPAALAEAFDEATERDLGPWYESTIWHDRRRLREAIRVVRGAAPEPDEEWHRYLHFMSCFRNDAELGLRFLETVLLAETPNQVLADPAVRARLADHPVDLDPGGPTRGELLAAVAG